MAQMVFWMLSIAFAVAAMVLSTAMDAHIVQFALAMIISAFIAVSAVRDFQSLADADAHPARRAAAIARHMGMLWAWAAVSICIIYALILQWPKWYGVFIVLMVGAGLCLFLANVLERDAERDETDAKVLGLISLIAKVQFAVTCIAVGGLLALGKFSASAFGQETKWAAVNILLCTGLGLAGLSGFAIANEASAAGADATEPQPRASASQRTRAAPAN